MEKSCCFTGYRPDKFSFPLNFGVPDFSELESKIYDAVFEAEKKGIKTFYCGMAAGFDLLCGKAVVDLKRMLPDRGIRLIAVIPFEKQSERFSPMWKRLYGMVLKETDQQIFISREYTPDCFSRRNKLMVDNSGTIIAYFDGKKGGTANTVSYALRKNRILINLCTGEAVAEQLTIE